MDLSLLSDADVRAADTRIRELWTAPMRIVVGVAPELRPSARVQRTALSLLSCQAVSLMFGSLVAWDGYDDSYKVDEPPTSVDEVIEIWHCAVDEVLRRLHQKIVYHAAPDDPPTVYDIDVLAVDRASSRWLPRRTLMRDSRKRLHRILDSE